MFTELLVVAVVIVVLVNGGVLAKASGRTAEARLTHAKMAKFLAGKRSRDVLALSGRHTHATLSFSTLSDSLLRFNFTAA